MAADSVEKRRVAALQESFRTSCIDIVRLTVAGALTSIFVCLSGFNTAGSVYPWQWYTFHGLSTSLAMSFAVTAISINTAFAALLMVLPDQNVAHAPSRAAALANFAMVTSGLMQAVATVAVAGSFAQVVPGGSSASAATKLSVFLIAVVAVAVAALVSPLTMTVVRAQLGLLRSKKARKRARADVDRLKQAVNGRYATRRQRILAYTAWTAGCGTAGVASLAVPLVIYAGSQAVTGWANLRAIGEVFGFAGATGTALLVYIGFGARARWRTGNRLWRLVAGFAMTAASLFLIGQTLNSLLTPNPWWAHTAQLLFIASTLGAPIVSLAIAMRYERGPAVVVMATALRAWDRRLDLLEKQVKSRKKDIKRNTASGAYLKLAA